MKHLACFLILLSISSASFAERKFPGSIDREFAGSAVVMKDQGLTDEESIPSGLSVTSEQLAVEKQNTIVEGIQEGMDAPIQKEVIIQ